MMIRYFLFFSILICIGLTSCSKKLYPTGTENHALINVDNTVQKYNLKMDIRKNHMSGILAVRKMDSGEIRIVGVTQFGLSLFDFGLQGENWQVHSCIEPMRNKRFLNLLESDFKLLFLPDRKVKKIEQKDDYTKYIIGKWFTKSETKIYTDTEDIEIKHPWINISIELEKIE